VRTTALRWGPSGQGRALAVLSASALALAVVLRRVELLALVTPALWALLTTPRTREPQTIELSGEPDLRCQEGDPCHVEVAVTFDAAVAHVRGQLALPSSLSGPVLAAGHDVTRLELDGEVVPRRWGRHRLGPLRLELLSRGGMRAAALDLPVPHECLVVPRAVPVAQASAPPILPNRLGEHATRAGGHGVEPLSVRPFASGDPVRRVNWRVSSRRQQLHVTVAAAERAVDVVLVVDAMSDVGVPPDTSLDRAVRTAAGMAERWLRERDRVGLVVLGGTLRWLTAATGRVQLQRVAEAVLWAWNPPGQVPPDLQRVPRPVLPAAAVVVFLTPLLDDRAVEAVAALRARASRVLVIDVLADAIPEVARRDQIGSLARRLWRLEWEATMDRLRRTGTPVLHPGAGELDRLLALALRRPT